VEDLLFVDPNLIAERSGKTLAEIERIVKLVEDSLAAPFFTGEQVSYY